MTTLIRCALLVGCILLSTSTTDAQLAAMSIDLGSQFMKIGLVKPGVPMEIVLNRESGRKTHTLLSIRNGERAFSDAAANVAIKYPNMAYVHLKDLLGKKLDNPLVHLYQKRFPFYKLNADDNRGTVIFETDESKDGEREHYTPETLLAMILSEARKITEKFADQIVKDVVITVPPYFNQAERRAVVDAAQIAGLNLLQLMNDNTAAGLNYGIFRMKEFTEDATQTLLVFDMGATKTTATIFEYQIVKDKVTKEKHPQMRILGFAYDRTLGGLEMSMRVRDHLVAEFRKAKKTKQDIAENPRSMAKLLKEAERVKQVLSANPDTYAQVENVHEEMDFKVKVTREEVEVMCSDLFDRVGKVVEEVLRMSEMSLEHVDQVVLMGAGTRVPKVKEALQKAVTGKELGKFLNTDEAIALGAVYQAAHLSKGFKVKRFAIKEFIYFPIQVDFHKQSESDEKDEDTRIIHRIIYNFRSAYPAKKMLTFSKHTRDFEFAINYGDLRHMTTEQLSQFGELNITRVDLTGVAQAIADQKADGAEFKGVKAHFKLDDSGIVHLESAEVVVERLVNETAEEEESTFASIKKKIGGFFGGGADETTESSTGGEEATKKDRSESDKEKKATETEEDRKTDKEDKKEKVDKEDSGKDEKSENDKTAQQKTDDDDKKSESTEKKKLSDDEKKKEKSKEGAKDKDEKTKEKTKEGDDAKANKTVKRKEEPKPKVVKVALKVEQATMDITSMADTERKDAKKRLSNFDKVEEAKRKRDQAHNALEAYIYETGDKLEQDEYKSISTEEEREAVRAQLKLASEWLEDEAGIDTKTEEFEEKLKTLKTTAKDIKFRLDQAKERPKAIEALTQMLNTSSMFVTGMKNLSADLQIFTEAEIGTLEKMLNETEAWWTEKKAQQAKLMGHEKPAYTLNDVSEKKSESTEKKKLSDDEKKKEKSKEGAKDKDEKTKEKTKEGDDAKANKTVKRKEEPKPKVVKVALKVEQATMDITSMADTERKDAKKRLSNFDKVEEAKRKRDQAHNALEAYIYETGDKLEQDEYKSISTEEEREAVRAQLKLASEWLEDEAGIDTKTEEFEEKLKTLKTTAKDIKFRLDQAKERPKAIEALTQMLNTSSMFVTGMKNLSADLQIFTEAEIGTLEKMLNETEAWWTEKKAQQAKLMGHEKPAYTLNDVSEKITQLDREVKYLVNKIRMNPPKSKNATAESEDTNKTTSSTGSDTDSDDSKEKSSDQGKKGSLDDDKAGDDKGHDDKADADKADDDDKSHDKQTDKEPVRTDQPDGDADATPTPAAAAEDGDDGGDNDNKEEESSKPRHHEDDEL